MYRSIKLVCVLQLFFTFILSKNSFAHPMPNSMIVLNIYERQYSGQIQLPLSELQSAIGLAVDDNHSQLVERQGDTLRKYLLEHIRPRTFDGKAWTVELGKMTVTETKSLLSGDYRELIVDFEMSPPPTYDLRNFYLDYDVILHQVASHRVLLHIKQDWQQGIVSEDSTMHQIGVIEWDIPKGIIPVFQVSLQQGSMWQGFENMVSLGITHIQEGTDHILFLLTLLLPSMLIVESKKWGGFIGTKVSLKNLLKIITAFTLGHSLTLFLGSVQWLHFPVQPIEILIAVTILISAFHAFRPIYARQEIGAAAIFGLIHGLAFAETLATLQLTVKQLTLSILGFNIGIELMQFFIVLLIYPLLLLVCRTRFYPQIRQVWAGLTILLAFAWLLERIQEKPNFITELLP
jgi:hypothetical protein